MGRGARAAYAMPMSRWWLYIFWVLPWATLLAADPLTDPLTLEQALAMADQPHPDLDAAQARLDGAHAGFDKAQSQTGVHSYLDLTPQTVLPALRVPGDNMVPDSRARWYASVRLYDFGQTRAQEDAARAGIAAREFAFVDARLARRLEIMVRYFDVILADLRYAADNEVMAEYYVTFDRARDRHELGQVSDVDLLALESQYQQTLVTRTQSQKRQASTRSRLALALNRPDSLPRNLVRPVLGDLEREAPEYKTLYEQARQHNPAVLAMRRDVDAARASLAAQRARIRPVLSAEAEAAWYERKFASRDELRATLNLRVPIYQGGEDKADVAASLARLHEKEASLARAELELRQTVLDLVQEIETLKVEYGAAKKKVAYRDLYVDRSRALYEMEVRTDLGDAMAQITTAQWEAAQAEFRLALAWAKTDALTGVLVVSGSTEEKRP
jgi:outer membrane protein TolC